LVVSREVEKMKVIGTEGHTVTRGPESWAIYIMLGLALAIEGITIVVYLLVASVLAKRADERLRN